MKKSILKSMMSVVLALTLVMSTAIVAFAANSKDAIVIYDINLTEIATPYADQNPEYSCELNTSAYYFDDQLEGDSDVVDGKWWYDETSNTVVSPNDTFQYGHVYTLYVLLKASYGYEFRVDENNIPLVEARVNGEEAVIDVDLTGKYKAFVEYTFAPCGYDTKISEVEIDITEPVTGEGPDFFPTILTDGVIKGEIDSIYYIHGVAWYDYSTKTFMNPSDSFREDCAYEVLIALTVENDAYFATKNGSTDLTAYVNGNKAYVGTAGKNDKYDVLVSYVFGDIREEVSYVEVADIDTPTVGANPDFSVTPVGKAFYINGVYWTDVTNSTEVNLKETDVFQAGHTYELQVWIRANEKYKFSTDEDECVDISAFISGQQAEVMIPGSEISAELSIRYTLPKQDVVSFVDIAEIEEPIAGNCPDMQAYCYTKGCNVDTVEWYDITDGSSKLVSADTEFSEGRIYRVVVGVVAEGNAVFYMVDGYNETTGAINGERANCFGSHDDRFVELYYDFAPCKASEELLYGDVNLDKEVSVSDVTELQMALAKSITLNAEQEIISDVNFDKTLSVDDVTRIQLYLAKIIPSFK